MIEIETFPDKLVVQAWEWLQEYPSANFDDYGPKSVVDFIDTMRDRRRHELVWLVRKDGEPCGIVAFLKITPRMGTLHGVCFAQGHCTSEEKRDAVRRILQGLFADGIEKVCASYFFDNFKIARLLSDLGATREGLFDRHTLRQGEPVAMVQVAFFKVL